MPNFEIYKLSDDRGLALVDTVEAQNAGVALAIAVYLKHGTTDDIAKGQLWAKEVDVKRVTIDPKPIPQSRPDIDLLKQQNISKALNTVDTIIDVVKLFASKGSR